MEKLLPKKEIKLKKPSNPLILPKKGNAAQLVAYKINNNIIYLNKKSSNRN